MVRAWGLFVRPVYMFGKHFVIWVLGTERVLWYKANGEHFLLSQLLPRPWEERVGATRSGV